MTRTITRTAALTFSFLLTLGLGGCVSPTPTPTPTLTTDSTPTTDPTPTNPANIIPDDVLRHCLASSMQQASIPFSASTSQDPSQVDAITQSDLDAFADATTSPYTIECEGMTSLEGLQNLHDPDLVDLELHNGHITDLTPLAGLTNLTNLTLHNQQITDLTPLFGLTNLTNLDLSVNPMTDLAPLAGLTNLTNLYLDNTPITDLAPLARLTHLTNLDLDFNPITDLAPLAGLTNLTNLNLDGNLITDLTPLAGLTNLTKLDLETNQITDVTPLAALLNQGCPSPSGCSFNFMCNRITDLSSLDWNAISQNTSAIQGGPHSGGFFLYFSDQNIHQTAETGTVALPTVVQPANDPNTFTWTNDPSVPATINQTTGTVTFTSPGITRLTWNVQIPTPAMCNINASPTDTSSPTTQPNVCINFSGTFVVTVTDPPGSRIATTILVVSIAGVLIVAGVVFFAVRRTRRTR